MTTNQRVNTCLRVGVDVGSRRHAVAVGLADGTLLDRFEIAHRPDGFEAFFARIEGHRQAHPGCGVEVAMEGYNGHARPLDQLVQQRDWSLYNVNNLKLARFKEIFPAASKSDAVDALQTLQLFQLQDHLPMAKRVLQRVEPGTTANDELKRLTRRRRLLIEEKSRVLSRLQSDLQAVCPGLLDITKDADNLWFLNLLNHVDALPKLARLRPSTVLSIRGIGRKFAGIVAAWQPTASFSAEVGYVGPMILDDVRRVLALREETARLQRRCDELMAQSAIAQRVDSLPGFGVICATTLAGEIGSIARFSREPSLALYLGMANLEHSSGNVQGAKAPKHVNVHAKAAMMTGVDRHRKQVPESQRYYEKKRAEGKSHNQAIRALGRHLCRVLFKMLDQNRDYEPR